MIVVVFCSRSVQQTYSNNSGKGKPGGGSGVNSTDLSDLKHPPDVLLIFSSELVKHSSIIRYPFVKIV